MHKKQNQGQNQAQTVGTPSPNRRPKSDGSTKTHLKLKCRVQQADMEHRLKLEQEHRFQHLTCKTQLPVQPSIGQGKPFSPVPLNQPGMNGYSQQMSDGTVSQTMIICKYFSDGLTSFIIHPSFIRERQICVGDIVIHMKNLSPCPDNSNYLWNFWEVFSKEPSLK